MDVDIEEQGASGWHEDDPAFSPWHSRELEGQRVVRLPMLQGPMLLPTVPSMLDEMLGQRNVGVHVLQQEMTW